MMPFLPLQTLVSRVIPQPSATVSRLPCRGKSLKEDAKDV